MCDMDLWVKWHCFGNLQLLHTKVHLLHTHHTVCILYIVHNNDNMLFHLMRLSCDIGCSTRSPTYIYY